MNCPLHPWLTPWAAIYMGCQTPLSVACQPPVWPGWSRSFPSLQDRLSIAYPVSIEIAISAEENRLRLIDALVTFFATLANLRPLVFFLDDLQWADPDTLAVLGRLAHRLAELPFLLVLAYRGEELPENDALGVLLHTLSRTHPQFAATPGALHPSPGRNICCVARWSECAFVR